MAQSRRSSNRQRQPRATQERAAANTLFGDAFDDFDPAPNLLADAANLPPDPPGILRLPLGIDAIVVAPADAAGSPSLAPAATVNFRRCDRHR